MFGISKRMSNLVLYGLQLKPNGGRANSGPHTWKIRLALSHLGVPYTSTNLSFVQINTELADKYRAQHPDYEGKVTVPVLQLEDGRLLMDSWVIADYLEETYAQPAGKTLLDGPGGYSLARFVDRFWFHQISSPFTSALVQTSTIERGLDVTSREYYIRTRFGDESKFRAAQTALSDPQALEGRLQKAREALKVIEDFLKEKQARAASEGHGPFIGGPSSPTYADFVLFGYAAWSRTHPAAGPGLWEHPELPHVADWAKRLRERFGVEDADLFVGVP